jgi:hypothetical protein
MASGEAAPNPAGAGPSLAELRVLHQAAPRYSAATAVQRAQILEDTTMLLQQTYGDWTKRRVRQWFTANAVAPPPPPPPPPPMPVQVPVMLSPYPPGLVPPLPPGLMAPYAPFVQLPQYAPPVLPGALFGPLGMPFIQTVAAPGPRAADDEEEEDAPAPAPVGVPVGVPFQVPFGLLGIPQPPPALMGFPGAFGGIPMQQPFPFILQPAPVLSCQQATPPPPTPGRN